MTTIYDAVETTNDHGQLTVKGFINLAEDVEMRNSKNEGRRYNDMVEPKKILVKAGTYVQYECKETRCGFYHTVRFLNGADIFFDVKKTETFRGRQPL